MDNKPSVFFGYGNSPELARETLLNACSLINETGTANAVSWEELTTTGRLIINAVLEQIDRSDLAAFDVTTLSENVLFELGYAIARGKRVWLLIDGTDQEAKGKWRQFRL